MEISGAWMVIAVATNVCERFMFFTVSDLSLELLHSGFQISVHLLLSFTTCELDRHHILRERSNPVSVGRSASGKKKNPGYWDDQS